MMSDFGANLRLKASMTKYNGLFCKKNSKEISVKGLKDVSITSLIHHERFERL